MRSLNPYLILEVAVESRQLEAVLLRWNRYNDTMVSIHSRVEVNFLVVDIHLKGITEIVAYDGYHLSRTCLYECTVSLCRIGYSDSCNLWLSPIGVIVITARSEAELESCKKQHQHDAHFITESILVHLIMSCQLVITHWSYSLFHCRSHTPADLH